MSHRAPWTGFAAPATTARRRGRTDGAGHGILRRPPAWREVGIRASLTILVTGAAGLIGADLCGALAERGHAVIAMVHRRARLLRCDGSGMPEGVAVLQGDITRSGLGLDANGFATLARCDRIVHCAADTRLGPGDHEAINVAGTQNLLDALTASRDATGSAAGLVHVSTAYVCGSRSGLIPETASQEHGTNPYEASKIEGERRVAAAGLGAAIARPSIVVGRWRDGAISRFGDLYALIRLVGSGRIRALPVRPGATLDLVPIDHVVGGLVDLVERFEAARDRVFHLATGEPMLVGTFCTTAFAGLHAPRLVAPGQVTADGRARHELLSLYADYLIRDPRFSTANLVALSGRVAPPVDVGFLHRMIDHVCDAGYLRRDPSLAGAV